jgi:hypothetical protein
MTFTIGRRGLLIVGVIAVLAVGAGVGYAAIPDGGGVIHGCYDNKGALRVIDTQAGDTCKHNESSLSWSQSGSPGPPGQNGTNGTNGTNGVSGYTNAFDEVSVVVDSSNQYEGFGEANCPSGTKPLGGGGEGFLLENGAHPQSFDAVLERSAPTNTGWEVVIQRPDFTAAPIGDEWVIDVDFVCAKVN